MVSSLPTDSLYVPGDVVSTTYGAGVIVGKTDDQSFAVRLWREAGKSIGSAAKATLNVSTILKRIPAAPGMTTLLVDSLNHSKASKQVLVLAYYQSRDTYLVSYIADHAVQTGENKLMEERIGQDTPLSARRRSSACTIVEDVKHAHVLEVSSNQLTVAPSAKFYPLLETLMMRGEETVDAATYILKDDRTRAIVHKTSQVVQNQVQTLSCSSRRNEANTLSDIAASIETSVTGAGSVDDNVKQVIQLVKDKELTELLETCKSRLSEMVKEHNVSKITKEALEKTGIRIDVDSMPSSFAESMDASRKAALLSIDKLLQQLNVDSSELEHWQVQVSSSFASAFDSLSSAAKSDESLNALFRDVNEKTSEWQETSGRLMQTRSASLFLEGAGRLQQRAAAIFSQGHFQWAGEIGEKLTKSFTEGDAALARLKSIELGDVVKNKLVEAIEVRSESMGGLDGIIAGALSNLKEGSASSDGHIQGLLNRLQSGASTATVDAHETLLSVLSSRSVYRDAALLQVESALCALERQFGDNVSPEDIARIARGEGGTSKLFEPIAKRAMEQIEKQLDLAESSVSDATALDILRKIRKIMSGDLTLTNVMDELSNVLNDDSFVQASETIVQQSEQVLDLIEGAKGNQAVNDALSLVEKAGITKDSIMLEIEKLNVNDLMETAGSAVTDEKARLKLLSTATDAALDFVLRILPSMPVPPFDGVNDGLIYHISNLSMEGFKVRKENIHIELAGMRATRSQTGGGESSAVQGIHIEEVNTRIEATELLIIDIRAISAVLDNAVWSFEQTYMPYLKAQGLADISFNGGAIRLQFELRRQRKESNRSEWEPVLCLHDRTCSIAKVDLALQGESRLAWIINKAASIFKGPLRDYIVRTIANVLVNRSGWILERMNAILSPHWDLIMRAAHLRLEDLVVVDERVVVKEVQMKNQSFIELVWREQLPLGINLLLNDDSGVLKVVDFPRGSQARAVCEKKYINPDVFKGSRIVAVNGSTYGGDLDDLFAALKEPSRPKTIRFEVADPDEAERVRAFVEGNDKPSSSEPHTIRKEQKFELRALALAVDEDLGIEFGRSLDNQLSVLGFLEGPGGVVLAAERSQQIKRGDLLVKVNESFVTNYATAVDMLEEAVHHRPLSLSFVDPYFHVREIFQTTDGVGGGDELKLNRLDQKIVISGFVDINGKAERSGIYIGDHLVFVNGQAVGAGCRWLDVDPVPSLADVRQLIANTDMYPMGLTFARPMRDRENRGPFRDDEAETICVTIEDPDELGCVMRQMRSMDIVVVDFTSVPGNVQRAVRTCPTYVSIEAINGQVVPSYASPDMVKSAINRSLKTEGKVELWLCDDNLKNWLHDKAHGNSN